MTPAATPPIRALLLDIEGVTTSIEFVHDTLFPYARARLAGYLEQHSGEKACLADMERLRQEHASDAEAQRPGWRDDSPQATLRSAAAYLDWLMEHDRKSTALKSIQGKIWQAGYHSGELRSHVYADVPPALERWRRAGIAISIYSSGSILAQKLLFAHTAAGDLCPFIHAYFDTTTGPKTVAESYCKIASALHLPPAAILFVSDTARELDAARSAGLQTRLCDRTAASLKSPGDQEKVAVLDEVLP